MACTGVMEDLGCAAAFNVVLHVPALGEAALRAVLIQLAAFRPDEVQACSFRATRPRMLISRCKYRCIAAASILAAPGNGSDAYIFEGYWL